MILYVWRFSPEPKRIHPTRPANVHAQTPRPIDSSETARPITVIAKNQEHPMRHGGIARESYSRYLGGITTLRKGVPSRTKYTIRSTQGRRSFECPPRKTCGTSSRSLKSSFALAHAAHTSYGKLCVNRRAWLLQPLLLLNRESLPRRSLRKKLLWTGR